MAFLIKMMACEVDRDSDYGPGQKRIPYICQASTLFSKGHFKVEARILKKATFVRDLFGCF